MARSLDPVAGDLFGTTGPDSEESLAPGALLLRGFALSDVEAILTALEPVVAAAPFRHMTTPGGFRMSVAMTSCGDRGWVTDAGGYRYEAVDPHSGRPWPALPPVLRKVATAAADRGGFPGFAPDACLVNRYEPGARMSLHQDKDERDLDQPIVSLSLGLPARFQFGGARREAPVRRLDLVHGDVLVWGGPSRLFYHGVLPLRDGTHPRLGRQRINLTFRRAE